MAGLQHTDASETERTGWEFVEPRP